MKTYSIALQMSGLRAAMLGIRMPGLLQAVTIKLEAIAVADLPVEKRRELLEQTREQFAEAYKIASEKIMNEPSKRRKTS